MLMSGDTYTPPRNYNETVAENGLVIDLHKGRENLIPQRQVQAEREAREAYEAAVDTKQNYEPSPVESAGLKLVELHKARQDRMAA
jgi:hypothetical protein